MDREEAARELLRHRKALYAYLYAIVRDPGLAEDLFQEVSLVLLRQDQPVQDFWPFAREVARRQALAALRQRGREPVLLEGAALDALDRGFDAVVPQTQARADALRECLKRLPDLWRKIVELRYWGRLAVGQVASRLVRSENTVSVTLNRIRSRLAQCVRDRLSEAT